MVTCSVFLSKTATTTMFSFGLSGDLVTIVVWTLSSRVFVTAETTSTFLVTVCSWTNLLTTFWIVDDSLITLTSLVTWVSYPETELTTYSVLTCWSTTCWVTAGL